MNIVIKAQVMNITPTMAAEWLSDRWPDQRKVRGAQVNRLLHDMKANHFKVSPDAILRIKGRLANGQHRLEALVQHGKPLQFLVMESNDEELYKIIDAGMKRTISDGIMHLPNSQRIPTVARWILAYEKNIIKHHADSAADHARTASGFKSKLAYSQVDLIDYCNEHGEKLSEAVEFVSPLYQQSALLRWSIGGALYNMAAARGQTNKMKTFLTALYTGGEEETAVGDLRNRLILLKGSKAKYSGAYIFAIALKGYQSYVTGTRATRGILRWDKNEEFPQMPK